MKELILFQGDSITDAQRNREWDQYAGSGYVTMIKGEFGFEYPDRFEFCNRGISGNRVVDLYARIKKDAINLAPDYLSILIGVNDVWHEHSNRNGVSAEKFERIYDMLIEEVKEALPGIRIILMEPFVLEGEHTCATETDTHRWQYFHDEVALRAAATKRLAEKYQLPFVELQSAFDHACERADASYWLFDGVHPTAMGYELIAREWTCVFKQHYLSEK